MPFIAGLVLTPVAAWIGTFLFFAALSIISARGLNMLGPEWLGALYFGTIVGSVFAAPVGLIVLPVTHAIMRRKGGLHIGRLVAIAAAFGFVSVLVALSLFWGPRQVLGDPGSFALTFGLAADGALTGAICAYLFGRFMRWFTLRDAETYQPPA